MLGRRWRAAKLIDVVKRKRTIYFSGAVVAVVLLVTFLVLNRNTSSGINQDVQPAYRVSAAHLIKAFATDEIAADAKYGGKVVEVHGTLRRIIEDGGRIIWMIGDSTSSIHVSCYLERGNAEKVVAASRGAEVRVKGVCTGLLSDIMLDNAIVMK